MRAASSKKAPSIDPMTIPAIAPPESPRLRETAAGVADPVAVGDRVADAAGVIVENAIVDAVVAATGKTTP